MFTRKLNQKKSKVGIFGYHPEWLQCCNNVTAFMTCYVVLYLIYGMAASYTSSMIPSIEKRFGFSSRTIGIFLAMNDVSHVLFALITAHFGGRGHRPRWMSFGCFLTGIALLLHASPEFLFPVPELAQNQTLVAPTEFCSESNPRSNSTGGTCRLSETNIGPLLVLALAQLLIGIGSTPLIILGLPFLDDNVKAKNAPVYFGISFSARIFGPVLGSALGAWCNSIYRDYSNPGFGQTDPHWISAWFQGYLITGAALCIFALTMGCFPLVLQAKAKSNSKGHEKEAEDTTVEEESSPVSLSSLPRDLKRLLLNATFICRTFRTVLDGIIIAGYMSFLPKFLAQSFRISGSIAGLAGGVPGVLAVAFGSIAGGWITKRLKLQPRGVACICLAASLVMATTYFSITAVGCKKINMHGLIENSIESCPSLANCACSDKIFDPVCHLASDTTFRSPCMAGCRRSPMTNQTMHQSCSCVSRGSHFPLDKHSRDNFADDSVQSGMCPRDCYNKLYTFVAVLFCGLFCVGIPLSGIVMLQFRVVDADLKNMASGLTALLLSGLGYLPGPLIFGALVIDPTCRLWTTNSCGEKGYCLFHDTDEFRFRFHLTAACIKVVGCVIDALVVYKVWNLKFEREPRPNKRGDSIITISTVISASSED